MSGSPDTLETAAGCPDREMLELLAAGAPVDPAIRTHVDGCDSCARTVSSIETDNAFIAEVAQANAHVAAPDHATGEAPPGYEIIDEIHRGGQGVVFRATQLTTKRTVALKMLLQGAFATARARERFVREAEVVASLRHPNIVTVYDSGVGPDGRPFLAMEYVEGVPLDVWAAEQATLHDGAAPVETVLEMAAQIADAIEAAHRRAVIHRDLKPANILVETEGEGAGRPRVLDFGLAKLARPEAEAAVTQAGEFLGTFAYAAPEQVDGTIGPVDTRTDVYALGVILYEMLAGVRPRTLEGSLADVVRTVTSSAIEPLEGHRPDLDQDARTIVSTALQHDPERRYQSIGSFRDDLRARLSDRAIAARRDETWYVIRKAIRRHRVPVATGAGIVLLIAASAVALGVLSVQKQFQATKAVNVAKSLVETLEQTTDFENPDALNAFDSLAVLEAMAAIVRDELQAYPDVYADLRLSLISAYLSRSQFAEAEAMLTEALDDYRERYEAPHEKIADALHQLSRLQSKRGDGEAAYATCIAALAMRRELYPAVHPKIAESEQHLASSLRKIERYDEALTHIDAAIVIRRALDPDSDMVLNAMNSKALVLRDMDRHADALALQDEVVAGIVRLEGPDSWKAARARHNLGKGLLQSGRHDEARPALTESLRVKRLRGDAVEIANTLYELARLERAAGDLTKAAAYASETLDRRSSVLPAGDPAIAEARGLLAAIIAEQNPNGSDAE